jgi:hypothetical protein
MRIYAVIVGCVPSVIVDNQATGTQTSIRRCFFEKD